MSELLAHLLARGVNGRASGADHRLLAWLADPEVNRRVFGLPLPATLRYYAQDIRALLTGLDPAETEAGPSKRCG
jgi:hypothetical protein